MKRLIWCAMLLGLVATAALGATGTGDRPDGRDVFSRIPDGKGFPQAGAPVAQKSVSEAWVDDGYTSATTGWGVDHFATISEGVQAVGVGGTVNVYPGAYVEATPNCSLYDLSGPYTFGLFLATDNVTVRGVDALGVPITNYAAVAATVQCDATNNFGTSGVFVQADGVTISGLELFQLPANVNKTIEVIGNNCTVQYCRLVDGGSLYIDDFRFDAGTNTSWVQGYSVIGNQFTNGTSLDLASGAGFSGPVSGRQVLGNSFEMAGWTWNAISFNGSDTGVGWFVYSVGGAVIQNNIFSGGALQYIRARGTYDNSQFDWASYFNSNTFDHAVAAGPDAPTVLREYSYTSAPYVFDHCRRIGTVIQDGITNAAAGDRVRVGAGTYAEAITVNKHIDLVGSGSGTNPATDTIITCSSGLGARMFMMQASGVSAADPLLFKDLRLEPNGVVAFEIHNAQVVSFVELRNVHVDGTNQTNDTESEIGLRVATDGTLTDLVVADCTFDHLTYGWYTAKTVSLADLSTVARVTLTNTSFSNNDAKGLYLEKLTDATFTNCVVHNNGVHAGFWNGAFNAGCDVNLKAGTYANLAFTACTFTDNGLGVKEGAGLLLKGRGTGTLDTSYSSAPATLSNVSVTNCTFNGNERGLRLGEPGKDNTTPTGVVVSGCAFTDNVQTYAGSDGSTYGGMVNLTSTTANAAGNNWDSPSGPTNALLNPGGTGDAVSSRVLFTPWVGRTTTTASYTATPTGPFFLEGTPAIGVDADGAPGFADGSIAAPNAYTRYVLDPEVLVGRPVTVGELHRISYLTKKGTLHTVDAADWFLYLYTDPYVGGHSSWYGNRLGSEPYFSENLVETAGAWNQWTTDQGANNRLRFFDSSPPGNYFGGYGDPFLQDFTTNPTYTSQTIHSMGLSVGTGWAAGFGGQLDGLVIELIDGHVISVNFESGNAHVAVTPASSGPINCSQTRTLTVNLTLTQGMPSVFGFNAVVRAAGPVNWGTITNLMPFGSTTRFMTFNQGDGSYIISGTTQGSPTQPISGAGTYPLFSVTYLPTGTGTANISFDSFQLRDPNNVAIPALTAGATIAIDCTNPAAVTNITAAPGHNKVTVGWTHSGADVVNYEVYRGLWYDTTPGVSAYPEYDDLAGDLIPTRPANRAEAAASPQWTLAGSPLVGATSFVDLWADSTHRGVYYYEVFAVDAANNGSAAATANKRATNYWLGDVAGALGEPIPAPNGLVNVADMNLLGTYFGLTLPLGAAGNTVDVGPTDNWSRVGIPTTDSLINFEDLMVFAMNFGVVSAAKSEASVGRSVELAWVRYDDGTQALRLVNGEGLKGLRVTADLPGATVAAGALLDAQSELTFLRNVGDKLDVSVAVTGVNTTFAGTGDLFVVRADAMIAPEDLTISARAIDNSRMGLAITAESGRAVPRTFALNANYPNPFNPLTKISFSLPESQHVKLAVYAVDGTHIATLVDETRAAGLHEIVWTGRDDAGQAVASGTYFYRIDAGPYSDVRKMTLMK